MTTIDFRQIGEVEPFKVYDIDDIFNLPEPEWLMEGVIPKKGSTLVYGPSNVGKSLVVLDWALKLATQPLHPDFHELLPQATILYIYAEGGHDLQTRVQSWEEGRKFRHPEMMTNIKWIGLEEEVNLRWNPEYPEDPPVAVQRLMASLETMDFDLVIFDPAQQVWSGMDGNSDRDVQMAFRLVREVAHRKGAASLIVHHARKDGDTFRGATTWNDLVDTSFSVDESKSVPNMVEVKNTKNRFGARQAPRRYMREGIILNHKLPGRSGVYLKQVDDEEAQEIVTKSRGLTGQKKEIWEALIRSQSGPLTVAEIEAATEVKKGSARKVADRLVDEGYAEKIETAAGVAWKGLYR